jgi:hypothetical protein
MVHSSKPAGSRDRNSLELAWPRVRAIILYTPISNAAQFRAAFSRERIESLQRGLSASAARIRAHDRMPL